MANLAVFASGRGTNFIAIHEQLQRTAHRLRLLVSDKADCGAARYARKHHIPVVHASYSGRTREQVEEKLIAELRAYAADLIALAGYMRVLTPRFVAAFRHKIINLHPSLLPAYPGLNAIRRSYEAGSSMGITVHFVDEGVDTGPVIEQHKVPGTRAMSFEEAEEAIHRAEHYHYPRAVLSQLDAIDVERASMERSDV